ncbi:MAG: hypothetical protein NTY94_09085 [Alphaproteobacteria bacterium]|nr:hypothetical protein [Alphaproteobacteria bacterium]
MSRIALMAAALVLGLAVVPTKITLIGDVSVPGISLGGSEAMAQRASDPRYQPGNSACRDGAGRRC